MFKKLALSVLSFVLVFSCTPSLKKPETTSAPKIKVLIAEISKRDSISLNKTYALKSEEALYEFGKKNRTLSLSNDENGFKVFNANRILSFRNDEVISFSAEDNGAYFQFRNKKYGGDFILRKSENGKISLINRIDLEEYLKGVVPSEIPSTDKSYLNAIKAQAICARTYALNRMSERKGKAFDLFGDQRDQVYGGLSTEKSLANQAVQKTRGDILMFNEKPATVFYHSTCGGLLEASGNVFNHSELPYMQSQQDAIGSVFACEVSPFFRWEKTFTINQIDSIFQKKLNVSFLKNNVSNPTSVQFKADVLKRSSHGRVNQLAVVYGDTSITLNNYQIRRFFSGPDGKGLPSTLFSISSSGDSLLRFKGAGFGHGVGMCQWGAMNMSKRGFKYYDILVNKYFRGTYLKKVY